MTVDEINALPERVRRYIMWLETDADPAGTVRENFRLREENAMLRAECRRLFALTEERASCETAAMTQRPPVKPYYQNTHIEGVSGEQYQRDRQAKRDALRTQYPEASDDLIDMLMDGWSLERAQEILAERNKPAKPETEAQRRKRAEREEREQQRYWERLQRERARLDMGAYRKGHEAGADVSFNRQAAHDKKHRLGN